MTLPTSREDHVEIDGFLIRYRESGHGGTVVMMDSITWAPSNLFDELAQTNRVIAFELPGFGSSPINTKTQTVRELAGTMTAAASKIVSDNYTLIGTSLGANVALWHSLLSPERVEALILISPTSIHPVVVPAGDGPDYRADRTSADQENARIFPVPDQATVSREWALTQRLKGATHDSEAEARLKEIQCATLVVFGSRDKMVQPEAASIYRQNIPNCNITLVYDAGHLIVADRPEALCSVVSDFVERRETFIVERRSSIINH